AAVLLASLTFGAFRRGWSQMGTDFPNYYTAARLTTQGAPLEKFYDWVWFQRQIHYAGIDHQLGGYIPHTPATNLPLISLTALPPQRAKQVWIAAGIVFLAVSVVLLSCLSKLPVAGVAVLALLAQAAVRSNFLIGQYYLLLVLLLTCGLWCL